MSFPITFAEQKHSFDVVAPVINLVGNGSVLAVGGISLAAITYVGLSALGVSEIAVTGLSVTFVSVAALGGVGILAGGALFAYFMFLCLQAARRI